MIALMEKEAYLIEGEELTFTGLKDNGELVIFTKKDGSLLEMPLEDLIEKDIQKIRD